MTLRVDTNAHKSLEAGARLLSLDPHFQRIPAVISVPLDPL